ncbi:hypothetical protein GCM10027290_29590 [Micromonospora sonneratiae]|uniref:RyR domain-containing protein n=1 Tax=Micromonospora sonneratiae TaxID=1184706 RepID=A0ABW3YFG6_9ACTN
MTSTLDTTTVPDSGAIRVILSEVDVARICHEAIRALQTATGDNAVPGWDDASASHRESTIRTVRAVRQGMTCEQIHQDWCRRMRADKWTYGPEKSYESRTHPCLVGYQDLPKHEKAKDELFRVIVLTLDR